MFSLPFEPVLDLCLWSPSALKLTLSDSTTCYSFLLQTSANSVTSPNLLKDFITCLSVTVKFLFCGYSWWFDYSHRHPFPVLGLSVSWLLLLQRSCLFSHISHPFSCHIISDASTVFIISISDVSSQNQTSYYFQPYVSGSLPPTILQSYLDLQSIVHAILSLASVSLCFDFLPIQLRFHDLQ